MKGRTSRIRFSTVTAIETPAYMKQLIQVWKEVNLDFLCIHPFRDGNGRVSRLLMLLQAYHGGINVGQYISLERLIEENK